MNNKGYGCPQALCNERDLLLRLREGEHRAFEAIYETYKRPLIGMLRLVKDRETVEELVHDLFLNVWVNRQRIDPEKPVGSYWYRSAANLALNVLRKAKGESRMRMMLTFRATDSYAHIEKEIQQKEHSDLLNNLQAKLLP